MSRFYRTRIPHTYGFDCPGCGQPHTVPTQHSVEQPNGHLWTFNNDLDRPTISPSLLVSWTSGYPPVDEHNIAEYLAEPWDQVDKHHVCHSFIRDGQIQFLGDCTHHLANQTVELENCWRTEDGIEGRVKHD